ncbi:hypothetical protein BKA56DRAFT_331574 [Ilyonectria sp. MPI-CAGE-AT-0026]|nr:hypothetical protein BKA56DRAFT_331574 [Ilyonectria sp. MPI-CAGE-AT-0026]
MKSRTGRAFVFLSYSVAWCEMPILVRGFQLVPLFPATAGCLQYKPNSPSPSGQVLTGDRQPTNRFRSSQPSSMGLCHLPSSHVLRTEHALCFATPVTPHRRCCGRNPSPLSSG